MWDKNMSKLDVAINEMLVERQKKIIGEWTEMAHKYRTYGVFYNDKDIYKLGDEAMEKAQEHVGKMLDIYKNPIVQKPLWIESNDYLDDF